MADTVITFRASKRQRRLTSDLHADQNKAEAPLPTELPQMSEEAKDTIAYDSGRLDTPVMDPPAAPGGASNSPASASPPPSVDPAVVAYWAAVDQEQLLVEESDGEDYNEAS